jgi:methyl-accepting chemotaxis protein
MENLLPWFIAVTSAAVVLQACLLAAMYLAVRKSSARMEAIASEVKDKTIPVLDSTQSILSEIRPRLQSIAESLEETTKTVRDQVQRADATVSDVVDRARLQVIRADELLSRTLDKVEQTSDLVHKTVVSPIRQVTGVMQGITAGFEFLLGGRGRKNGSNQESRRPVPQDEMFI